VPYFTLVRLRLEYAAVVWNSITSTDVNKLERIQQKLRPSLSIGGTYRLHLQGRRNRFSKLASKQVACHLLAEPISSTLKIEAICSSETSVQTQRTTRRHIPEDDTLKNFDCPARVYCPPATGPCAVPFTRWQLLDCEVVGERQLLSNWPVQLLAEVFTQGQYLTSSYWPANWHRVNGPLQLSPGSSLSHCFSGSL
jgi:hypothetical protein